jgi:hypothetical protein
MDASDSESEFDKPSTSEPLYYPEQIGCSEAYPKLKAYVAQKQLLLEEYKLLLTCPPSKWTRKDIRPEELPRLIVCLESSIRFTQGQMGLPKAHEDPTPLRENLEDRLSETQRDLAAHRALLEFLPAEILMRGVNLSDSIAAISQLESRSAAIEKQLVDFDEHLAAIRRDQ